MTILSDDSAGAVVITFISIVDVVVVVVIITVEGNIVSVIIYLQQKLHDKIEKFV